MASANLNKLIDMAAPYWAAEAEVIATYFASPQRTRESDRPDEQEKGSDGDEDRADAAPLEPQLPDERGEIRRQREEEQATCGDHGRADDPRGAAGAAAAGARTSYAPWCPESAGS